VITIEALVGALTLERTGADQFRATNVAAGHDVVFGGQLIAQSLLAGLHEQVGLTVKTVHTVFVRSASPTSPVDIVVERMHRGRTFASATVTISQGERLCTRSIVLLNADEADFVRHADTPPAMSSPEDAAPTAASSGAWEVRVVDDVDVGDPDAVGPAELDVWTRFVGAPAEPAMSQALLGFASDGFLIGTAMRPHPGVGQDQAHRTLTTGVISHTLTFHESFFAGEWMLLSQRSPYAGHGRSYGRGDVFRPDGQLAASFVQDAMIRPKPTQRGGPR
jgi:acyl-CoA thioesterase-2